MENQIVHSMKRTENEEVRVSIRSFKDKVYLDLRIFFKSAQSGEWIPSKKGLTLSTELISSLREGLEKAEQALITQAA